MQTTVSVVIPTRNRPDKLRKCLCALSNARDQLNFNVVVCDSTPDQVIAHRVSDVCKEFHFVTLVFHSGRNVSAARNACAKFANADILINVDDDIYVEPNAIRQLLSTYHASAANKYRVVAGSVKWGQTWSRPVVMRKIGYGRAAKPGEKPDFLVGAFFAYSRKLALAKPWNESIRGSDDRFMGALWKALGVELLFEPDAHAFHDDEHTRYGVDQQDSHIYANLFEATIAKPRVLRALEYELLGFIWGAKATVLSGGGICKFVTAWSKGHRDFCRDWMRLKKAVSVPLPPEL